MSLPLLLTGHLSFSFSLLGCFQGSRQQVDSRAGTGGPPCWPFLQAMPLFLQFTNRCLLKWLKLWDLVVFGRERPARRPRPGVELARGGKEAASSSKWRSHEQVLEDMLEAELDPSRRPRQKVRPSPAPHGCAFGHPVPSQPRGVLRHI